ncbi:MAG: PepSY-associated TM helix domain-containing protein [Pseudomonadota bacterium]
MNARTVRIFYVLHKWTGLIAGFALFVAFYAGALTMFHGDIERWQRSFEPEAPQQSLADAQTLLDLVLSRHPELADGTVTVNLPSEHAPLAEAYFNTQAGFQHATLDELKQAGPDGLPPHTPHSELAEFINELHYALGIPLVGGYLMGVISLIYGLALVSGVLIHLPRLSRDVLALRVGGNLKLFWQDAHNLVGVVSLPFHIVFAWTGAVLGLGLVVLLAVDALGFQGRLMPELPRMLGVMPPSAQTQVEQARLLPLEALLTKSRTAVADKLGPAAGEGLFEPVRVRIQHPGKADAIAEVRGQVPGALGGSGAVAISAVSGQVIDVQVSGARDANHGTLQVFYDLHFGHFGGPLLTWLYALMGMAGAFLFYSGNLLFIEARRKHGSVHQTPLARGMARATVGVCLGACVGMAAAFLATPWLSQASHAGSAVDVAFWERAICFLAWAVSVVLALVLSPVRAAEHLLWWTALLSALAMFSQLLLADASGPSGLVVNLVLGGLALGAGGLAWRSRVRGREGRADSVWALRQAG